MARPAPVDTRRWLPSYGWWPHPDRYATNVVVSPYHHAVAAPAEYAAILRGYAGSVEPLWEHDMGCWSYGEERVVALDDLQIPEPPDQGGVLEVHIVRRDRAPTSEVAAIGMWIDAVGREGGGYLIPTQPIRGAFKAVARDDVQVVPGVIATVDTDTEVVLVNPLGETITARLVVSSAEGLTAESRDLTVHPYSAWTGSLRRSVRGVRPLLEPSGGVGSLAVYSNHRLLPHFGFSRNGGPVGSMDHTAPIFAG